MHTFSSPCPHFARFFITIELDTSKAVTISNQQKYNNIKAFLQINMFD